MNEELAKLPFQARLLFIGLWTLSDRRGFVEDRPRKIKAQLFPYDKINVEKLLEKLCNGFLERFFIDDVKYIRIINFCKHQIINRKEIESTVPELFWNGPGTVPESLYNCITVELYKRYNCINGITVKQEGEEVKEETEIPPPPPPDFDTFYVSDNGINCDYEETLSDFLKSDKWQKDICSELNIDKKFLVDDMKKFLLDLNNQDQFPRKLADTKKHYFLALKKHLKAKAEKLTPKTLTYELGKKKK